MKQAKAYPDITAEQLVKMVRKNGCSMLAIYLFMVLMVGGCEVLCIRAAIQGKPNAVVGSLCLGVFLALLLVFAGKMWNPFGSSEKMPLFKEFGDPESLAELMRRGGENQYPAAGIILTDTYVMQSNSFLSMVPLERITGMNVHIRRVHPKHGRSYNVYGLQITCDTGEIHLISFPRSESAMHTVVRDAIIMRLQQQRGLLNLEAFPDAFQSDEAYRDYDLVN